MRAEARVTSRRRAGASTRGTLEQLSADERERVRTENRDFIERTRIDSVAANVLYVQASA